MTRFKIKLDITSLGNCQSIVTSLGRLGKKLAHFTGTLKINVVWINHSAGIIELLAGAYGTKTIVGLMIVLLQKMHIVRRHQAEAHLLRQINQSFPDTRIVTFMILYLDKEPVGPEDFEKTFRRKACRFFIAVGNISRNLAFYTCRGADQTFVKLGQDFLIYSRAIVKALKITGACQFDQILIAGIVFGQKNQMVCRIGNAGFRPVTSAAGRNISLDAKHRFDVSGDRLCIKLNSAEHIAMVCYRHSLHFEFLATLEKFFVRYSSIQQ